ncbi:hypothetical protein LDENG_00274520 [Lucifuga dentata]|nr:hypothetical protein LDENG_00274520 [Lucifuga dentata]
MVNGCIFTEPKTFAVDFSSGYLIGEVLHKHQLQDDFKMFTKSNTSVAKRNNFTRIEPTLQLLGITFDTTTMQGLIQEQQGVAKRLLYQLYVLLEKKKKAGISGTVMEKIVQPAITVGQHTKEHGIHSDLHNAVKDDTEMKLPKISQHYEKKAQQWNDRSVTAQLLQQQLKVQEEKKMKNTERHLPPLLADGVLREAHATESVDQGMRHQKQNEIMTRNQVAIVQMPKPPAYRSLHNLQKKQEQWRRREQQAQKVQAEIAQFERNRKKFVTSSSREFPLDGNSEGSKVPGSDTKVTLQSNSKYIQQIRQRLEDDAMARQQREKRRCKFLVEQLKAHEAQQEAQREEQLVKRLTRQTKQEQRLAVQLLQMRTQKEVILRNRLFREEQYQQQREKEFHEALEREAALAWQAKLDHANNITKECEIYKRIAAERAQSKYNKHFQRCREILEQMVDLATKVGEYRLLTANLIPEKLMREWKELLISGLPLYEPVTMEGQQPGFESLTPLDPVELERQEKLNNQDYDEYTNMVGEWAWPEEAGETKLPPTNNAILGHVVLQLRNTVHPPIPGPPPPSFPHFTLKACVLGKFCSGKTTCLAKIAKAYGVNVLSAATLIEEALNAYQDAEFLHVQVTEQEGEKDGDKSGLDIGEENGDSKPSIRAVQGAAVEKELRKGQTVPNELIVDIIVEAIRQFPPESGWILDGFPLDITQACLLEKALGGSADVRNEVVSTRTELAIAPTEVEAPPLPGPMLQLALLLDISDECVIRRAVNRAHTKEVVEEASVEQPHQVSSQDFGTITATAADASSDVDTATVAPKASPDDTTITPATTLALPPRDKGLEMAQIQHRITAFQDTWPKLEKWFGGEKNILVCLNAEVEEDELYKRVETVLQEVMMKEQKDVVLDKETAPDSSSLASPAPLPPPPAHQDGEEEQVYSLSNENPQEEVSKSPVESAPPCPGSANWVYVDEPLPPEIPEYLCPYWDTVCDSYVSNIKTVMQKLRSERTLIIHHLFNIREEYKQYLGRPDLKQEVVSQWQTDYNNMPDDVRDDEDTLAELHQRLDDLREHLWDICDKRKEEDEQEKAAISGDGWHYYLGMYTQVLPVLPSDFVCVPLLDIADSDDPMDNKVDDEEDSKKTKFIPLLPRRPSSSEVGSKTNGQQPDKPDKLPHEKLISDYEAALTAINNWIMLCVSSETHQKEVETKEQNENAQDKEKEKKASQSSASSATKTKKKLGSAKNKEPPLPPEPSPAPVNEISPEDIHKQEVREKIHKEYTAAVYHEEHAVKGRIEHVKIQGLAMLHSLENRAEETFSSMQKWLEAHYLAEMNSIDQLTEVVRHHIESGSKLQNELVLESSDFYLNGDVLLVASQPPPPRPPPLERATQSTLTIAQLQSLYQQLCSVAPSGQLPSIEFSSLLCDIISVNVGSNNLPETWISMDETQLMEMVSLLTEAYEMVDWRRFLLSAALPWPFPSLTQLLITLQRFQAADSGNTGYIDEEQYLQTELWFPSEEVQTVPEDPSEPLLYDRLANLHKFFFQLFADHSVSPPRLDYVSMLQYFAADHDSTQGFIRALSVVLGQHLKQPSTSQLVKSMPSIEEATEFISSHVDGEQKEEIDSTSGSFLGEQNVSIPALLAVICHKGSKPGEENDFLPGTKNWEEHTEHLMHIFTELDFSPEDHIPFSALSQHPFIQNLMENSIHYHLINIHKVLHAHQDEEEVQSMIVS